VPLTLLAGPANAGKVALLLERFRADLARDPLLIVPNRSDVDVVQRELLADGGALLRGAIETFDGVFARIASGNGDTRPVLTDAQRALLVRRVAGDAAQTLGGSTRFAGFADTLAATLGELEVGLVEPEELEGDLRALFSAYRADLDRLRVRDRDGERRYGADRIATALGAWDDTPVYAYGFEDLTGAQWALLETLAARVDVTVSLPYEPGRVAFEALERTSVDLARLADGRIEELPAASHRFARPELAYLERNLYVDERPVDVPLEGALRFLEAAGTRGLLELVGEEILALLKEGTPPSEIAFVCPSVERWRVPLETVFGGFGIPYGIEGPLRLSQTPFGAALLALLRFAWLGGERHDLYGFMRSPYSGLRRDHVDYLEGRLRGRAVRTAQRVEEETLRLRGQSLPFLELVRSAVSELDAVRAVGDFMLGAAHGVESPPVGGAAGLDLEARESVDRLLDELDAWQRLDGPLRPEELVGALERTTFVPRGSRGPGRVAVLDLLRARTRHYDVVFVAGLEEGALPRRSGAPTLLADDQRAALAERRRGARLVRTDPVARERYLFYTACTRARRRLYLAREAATEDGSPRGPSPFWDDVRMLFSSDDVLRWTRRRTLAQAVWPVEAAPTERERLRAVTALAETEPSVAATIAGANGWERRLQRARSAFERPTRLTHPTVLRELAARGTFGVTELELFADCSSMWLFERVVDPRAIDGRVDARLRGQVAHQALFRFFSTLPKQFGTDRVEATRLDEMLVYLGECIAAALTGQALNRLDLEDVERHELEQGLLRDLGEFVRSEAESEVPLVPRRFEVSFGTERSAPELKAGLDLGGFAVSGKIDRIDVDPFSARGIVQDYKSGKTAHSAAQIESEARLQVPLYMLVLRDLLGIEPIGGLYRALAGERRARGLLQAAARDDGIPGFASRDYYSDDDFWAAIDAAVEQSRGIVARIREGDVGHDPKHGFPCPSWCDLAPMCRVSRA
jgi:ATP-dependent helicase/nuclease subunit B